MSTLDVVSAIFFSVRGVAPASTTEDLALFFAVPTKFDCFLSLLKLDGTFGVITFCLIKASMTVLCRKSRGVKIELKVNEVL